MQAYGSQRREGNDRKTLRGKSGQVKDATINRALSTKCCGVQQLKETGRRDHGLSLLVYFGAYL